MREMIKGKTKIKNTLSTKKAQQIQEPIRSLSNHSQAHPDSVDEDEVTKYGVTQGQAFKQRTKAPQALLLGMSSMSDSPKSPITSKETG